MAKRMRVKKNLRVFLDEELKPVPQHDDETGDPLKDEVTGEPVMKDEMVTVVRVIGNGKDQYPEPEEGTIFELALMRFKDAMRFQNLNREKRAGVLDEYAPKSIKGWERMETGELDSEGEPVFLDFNADYIEFIPTMDRLHLVMESVMQSMGDKGKVKGKG